MVEKVYINTDSRFKLYIYIYIYIYSKIRNIHWSIYTGGTQFVNSKIEF